MAQLFTWDMIQQIIRYAMQIIGAILIKDSVEGAQYWEAATAGLINIAGAVWWWFANRQKAVIAKVAEYDSVEKVILNDAALARELPNNVTTK